MCVANELQQTSFYFGSSTFGSSFATTNQTEADFMARPKGSIGGYRSVVKLLCKYCGSNFEVYPSREGKSKYCSKKCVYSDKKSLSIKHKNLEEKNIVKEWFDSATKVLKQITPDLFKDKKKR